jgi:hypothetical protein
VCSCKKTYIKWTIQAVFVTGPDGRPKLLDNGVWQVVSGTGKFERLKGAGTVSLPTPNGHRIEGTMSERNFASERGARVDVRLCQIGNISGVA